MRSPPRPDRGIWLLTVTTGTDEAAASCSAARLISAPGPVDTSKVAADPVVRAKPSAAKPADSSVRNPTYLRSERASAENVPSAC